AGAPGGRRRRDQTDRHERRSAHLGRAGVRKETNDREVAAAAVRPLMVYGAPGVAEAIVPELGSPSVAGSSANTSTRFRPFALARYSARSAFLSRRAASGASSGKTATPKLALTAESPPRTVMSAIAVRTRSATLTTVSRSASGSSMMNSSPP